MADIQPPVPNDDLRERSRCRLNAVVANGGGDPRVPWYMAPERRDLLLSSLARVPAGCRVTEAATAALKRPGIVPAGTGEAAALLDAAADALVKTGEIGIFTLSFRIHARKPEAGVPQRRRE